MAEKAEPFRLEMDARTRVVTAIRPNGQRITSAVHKRTGEAKHVLEFRDLIQLQLRSRDAADFIRRVDAGADEYEE